MDLDKVYKHQEIEKKWSRVWEESNSFTPKKDSSKTPFSILPTLPPVSFSLKLNSALSLIIGDLLFRYQKMLGKEPFLIPGIDYAGVATEVEFKKGGEKNFEEFIAKNKKEVEKEIKRLGISYDWTKSQLTYDPRFKKPLYTIFKNLYDQGLILKEKQVVNWCPSCQTALSFLETKKRREKTTVYFIRYPLESPQKTPLQFVTAATPSPETILGDIALAINPTDNQLNQLIGQKVLLPLVRKLIPIIGDSTVDPKLFTGVAKVTPAHDFKSFKIAESNNLEKIVILDKEGKMADKGNLVGNPTWAVNSFLKSLLGKKPQEAREKIIEELSKQGFLEKEEEGVHFIGVCRYCGSKIEPILSYQWFVKMSSLERTAVETIKSGRFKIFPEKFKIDDLALKEKGGDWCISRQNIPGYPLPVWYCLSCQEKQADLDYRKIGKEDPHRERETAIVSLSDLKSCPYCGSDKLIQDQNTLDSWFVLGCWSFLSLGWKQNEVVLANKNLFSLLSLREISLSLSIFKDVPFKTIYLHGSVKQSKKKGEISLSNLINEYGADVTRAVLYQSLDRGFNFSLLEGSFLGFRNLSNKIWNTLRFILLNFEKTDSPQEKKAFKKINLTEPESIEALEKFNLLIKSVSLEMENFRFSRALKTLTKFFRDHFSQKLIPLTKKGLKNNSLEGFLVLVLAFEGFLRLFHPFFPFITEEAWQKLKELVTSNRWLVIEKEDTSHPLHSLKFLPSIMASLWPKEIKINEK